MDNHSLSSDEMFRYSRQISLKEIGLSGQEKLKNARVLCVGLGGLGSSLLPYLAAAGVGRLGLVDSDVVELSNLQRQILYQQSQIAHPKTAAAGAQIQALNSAIQMDLYCEKITEENAANLISQYDIVADCSDNFYTNYLIHDVCFAQRKPYVYASVSQFQGHCSFFNGKGPCLRCLFPTPDPKLSPACNERGILGVVPGLLGVVQATEILKWILGVGQLLEKKLFIADLLNMTFREIQLSQSPDCPLCVHHEVLQTIHYPTESAHCLSLVNHSITANNMRDLLKNREVTLVDVRSIEEHDAYNIGGIPIPLTELPKRLAELNPNHFIVLYCHSSQRSIQALNVLLEAGFTFVKYLIGGISSLALPELRWYE